MAIINIDHYDCDLDVQLTGGRLGIALAEAIRERGIQERLEDVMAEQEKRQRYMDFVKFHDRHSVNERDYLRDCELKTRSLLLHFPGRFGSKGKQPIKEFKCGQRGRIYSQVLESARDILERAS